jgi:hypothetical protein
MKTFFRLITLSILGAYASAPLLAFAQTGINISAITPYSNGLITVVNTILVPFLIAIAFMTFLWGVYKYFILGASNESEGAEGRQFVLWGIIGFVVIICVWGIVNLVMNTFGFSAGTSSPTLPTINGSGSSGNTFGSGNYSNGNNGNGGNYGSGGAGSGSGTGVVGSSCLSSTDCGPELTCDPSTNTCQSSGTSNSSDNQCSGQCDASCPSGYNPSSSSGYCIPSSDTCCVSSGGSQAGSQYGPGTGRCDDGSTCTGSYCSDGTVC